MKCVCEEFKTKAAGADLDWKFDFAPESNGAECSNGDYLQPGELIQSFTLTIPPGLTTHDQSLTDMNRSVTFWLAGGTKGQTYTITCQITTNLNRIDIAVMYLTII